MTTPLEVQKERAFLNNLINTYGASPPRYISERPTASSRVFILNTQDKRINNQGKAVYLGIDTQVGWVETTILVDTVIAG